MSHIILIHGFATGVRFSIFRPACGIDAGFTAFRKDVEDGTAAIFRWDVSDEASFFQTIDPRFSFHVFKKELNRTQNSAWQERLYQFLKEEQPSTIVCHSLGCQFMLETMNRFGLPLSVRTIIFNQSAIQTTAEFTNINIQTRIDAHTPQCVNVYCPWDPTLWLSAVVHGVIHDGLFPFKKRWMTNKFIPLYLPINLHTSAIRSRRFRDWVKSFSD